MEIHVWSDVACPWCYIGKRSLESALANFPDRANVVVRWRSFELDPGAPAKRDLPMNELLAKKYGMSASQVEATQLRITETAATFGLNYQLDDLQSGNTFDAHRIIHLATHLGKGDEMKERLLKAYFEEGQLMSDHAVLTRCAEEVGLPAEEILLTLTTDRFAADVRFDEELAANNGFSGVPTFVVDGRFAVSGAQDPGVLLQMLERAAATAI